MRYSGWGSTDLKESPKMSKKRRGEHPTSEGVQEEGGGHERWGEEEKTKTKKNEKNFFLFMSKATHHNPRTKLVNSVP